MAEPTLESVERERDLWKLRYERLMGWVVWLRDKVGSWHNRRSWDGLNKGLGLEDLFMASVEIQAEVSGDEVEAARYAQSKDAQFREATRALAERSEHQGKPQGEDAPDA